MKYFWRRHLSNLPDISPNRPRRFDPQIQTLKTIFVSDETLLIGWPGFRDAVAGKKRKDYKNYENKTVVPKLLRTDKSKPE